MENKYYAAVDIGGTAVKLGILNQDGVVLKEHSAPVNFDGYKTPILTTVLKELKPFINESGYELVGIGVSATGQIDTNKGEVIGSAGHIDNWLGSKIKKEMEETFHLPTTVCNDANCMILGEKWLGGAKQYSNVVGITIGTGIGGGIIVNNNILLGDCGLAGEVGHISIHHNGPVCTCGSKGCYENYASTTYLVKQVQKLYPNKPNINGKWIFDEVKTGNKEVTSIVDEWINDIAIGLVSLIHIFNPSCILIGGGVSAQKEFLIDPLTKKIQEMAMPRFLDHLEIKQATLQNKAGMIGALKFHLDTVNNE